MKRAAALCVVAACYLGLAWQASGAVFQYSVPVKWVTQTDKGPQPGSGTAFLWVPAEAKQIRGVIFAGMTVAERDLVQDETLRKACAEQQIGIIFMTIGLSYPNLQEVLDDLAKVSGYKELAVAPMMFVGHSAGGPQARDMAVKYEKRCFGLMQYRGGPPWDAAVAGSIPSLMMVGEFDEYGGTMRSKEGIEHWEKTRDRLVKERTADESKLWSMIVEPGAGHFAWSERNAKYLALFVKKAAAARIPATWAVDGPAPELKAVDYKSGWLTDPTLKSAGEFAPAAYGDYKGPKGQANWHFDKELAEATVAYHQGMMRKDQFIKWSDPYWVDAGTRYFHTSMKWVGDGQTFEVHPVYMDVYPSPQPNAGPRWPWAGEAVGHSTAKIEVRGAGGPVVGVGNGQLRFQFNNLCAAGDGGKCYFMAYSVGDDTYRYTEQIGMTNRGFNGLTGGKDQKIAFEPVGNLKTNSGPVELKGSSDSGLKVEYYVGIGPAEVVDGKLTLKEIPARASYPITVKVVAYQFGSGVKPEYKTAKPVEQVIQIEKP